MRMMAAAVSAMTVATVCTITPSALAGQGPTPRVVMCHGEVATIVGTAGHDVIKGTSGQDVIAGLGGKDILMGLGGDDLLCGGSEFDRIYGGAGNDRMFGGTRSDFLWGRAGDDVLNGGPGAIDSLEGGHGRDELIGGPGPDFLFGGPGDDKLLGGSAQDNILGDAGNDRILGGPDRDILDYASWCRAVCTPSATAISANLSRGTVAGGARFGHDRVKDAEELWTGKGNDHLVGSNGPDTFSTGLGRDAIQGRRGIDTIIFSAPNYELPFSSAGVRLDLAHGTAVLHRHGGATVIGHLHFSSIENAVGSQWDHDVLLGDRHDNLLVGGYNATGGEDGSDHINGRGGNDRLFGKNGNDVLTGETGNDYLDGGRGNNTMDGGPGTDTCTNPATGPRTTRCEASA